MRLVITDDTWSLDLDGLGWVSLDILFNGGSTMGPLSMRNQWEKDYLESLAMVYGNPAPEILLPGHPDFGKSNCCMLVDMEPPKGVRDDCFLSFPNGFRTQGMSVGKLPDSLHMQVKGQQWKY